MQSKSQEDTTTQTNYNDNIIEKPFLSKCCKDVMELGFSSAAGGNIK